MRAWAAGLRIFLVANAMGLLMGVVIQRHNAKEVLMSALNFVFGLMAYGLAGLFFYFAVRMVARQFDWELSGGLHWGIVLAGLSGVTITGWRKWKRGEGHDEYAETDLYFGLAPETSGAQVVEHYATRVTGPAYFLSQLFVAGPLQLLRGYHRLRRLIPREAGLEERLNHFRGEIEAVGRWHAASTYPGRERELGYLVRMGLVDFSPRTGKVRGR
ncbi:MAG: hypothetical protein AAGD22_12845 [Verrucomicrobiota bacterium]